VKRHPHVCHLSHYFSKKAGPKRFYFLCHKKLWFPRISFKIHSLKTKGSWIVMHMNFKTNPRKLGQKSQHCGHNTDAQLLKPIWNYFWRSILILNLFSLHFSYIHYFMIVHSMKTEVNINYDFQLQKISSHCLRLLLTWAFFALI
jgi:hypothetical protein